MVPGSVLGLLLLLVAAHGATWFYVTGRILDGIPVAVAQANQAGWAVQAGAPHRAGWPLAATVRVPSVSFTRALGGTGITLALDHLDLLLSPVDLGHLQVDAGGPATLLIAGEAPVSLLAREAVLLLPLSGVGPARLRARDLVIGPGTVSVGAMEAQVEPGGLDGTAGPIALSPALAAPFDGGAQLRLRLLVTPPLPAAATPAQSAALWQAAGGRVTAPELRLDWGALLLEGTVSGGLDAQLQPTGEAHLKVTGALDVLEALSRGGLVQPGPAAAARAVLTLLILAAHGGPVTLPVVLKDRVVTAAQFALLRLPKLEWAP